MTCGRVAAAVSPFAREAFGNEGFLMAMCIMQAIAIGVVAALQIEPNLKQLGEISGETASLGTRPSGSGKTRVREETSNGPTVSTGISSWTLTAQTSPR
jgi:hypothetical protein